MNNPRLFEDDVPNEDSIYQERLNGQWVYTVALREAFAIARRGNVPTYAETLAMANKLAGEILGRQHLLFSPGESNDAQKYREKARLMSKRKKDELLKSRKGKKISPVEEEATLVTAIEVVDLEINDLTNLLKSDNGQNPLLRADLDNLRKVRGELEERETAPRDEHEILFRDWNKGLELPVSGRGGNGYHDFALPNNRIMRIRMLHPHKAEMLIGVDLLYEYHQPDQQRARLAAVQYKIPKAEDKGLTIYEDIRKQLKRLESTFCKKEFCGKLSESDTAYRLSSYCAAFLRPTDKIQKFDPRLVTTGYHLRVCDVLKCQEKTREGTPRLSLEMMREQGISSRIFEELFNTNRLGSRWIEYKDLEIFHHQYEIIKPYEQASIYIQEVPVLV